MQNKRENQEMRTHIVLMRLYCGVQNLLASNQKKIIAGIYMVGLISLWKVLFGQYIPAGTILWYLNIIMFLMVGIGILLFAMSGFVFAEKCNSAFRRMGMLNHLKETPIYLGKRNDSENERAFILRFESHGISLEKWIEKKEEIENALDIEIDRIQQGKNKKLIEIYATNGDFCFPEKITYNGDLDILSEDVFVLGESSFGKVFLSLNLYPHTLIGGSTGSGKTWILKYLLYQGIRKKYEIFIADFKGGVDYSKFWHARTTFIYDIEELLRKLEEIVLELERRKILFRESECSDINQYNLFLGNKVKRYIFACDELAELLDKTGLSKEEKEKITKIEGFLATIARQGRAFGIHLILATQRPDANILSGQIKNNIDYRICGKADNVLSQIILDNTSAAEVIPKNSQGIFVNQEGRVFKGYMFDDKQKAEIG